MRFAEPQMLFFLGLPLVVVAGALLGASLRKRAIKRFGAAETVEAQLVRPHPYLRAAKGFALFLGIACLALASARPQYGGRIQMLKKRGIDIVVALDFSKSMLAQDVRPNRLERAKLELNELINMLTGDRIGLVAFAGDTMRFPLTTDYAAAIAFWRDLGPYDMPVGGTAIGKALTAAVRMLHPEGEAGSEATKIAESGRSKVIILLTDGEDHVGDPVEAASDAAEQGITVYTVGFGSDSPELVPRYLDDGTSMGYQKKDDGQYVMTALTPENEDKLKEIASKTGGRYYRAGSDLAGVASVIDEIRKMKQTEVEARQITVYDEVFQWFLGPAALLLLLAFALPERWSFTRRLRWAR
jgi:Ca-activated chloride channel homolog